MKYKLKGLTIYRADSDGFWEPVKACKSETEAKGLMVALTFNPEAGAKWPVIVQDAPPPAKSGDVSDGWLPGIPEAYQEYWQRTYERVLADTGSEHLAQQAALGTVRRLMSGMAVKSARNHFGNAVQMQKSGDLVLVNGWGVMFGDPDILDSWQTYFAKDTDFLERYYPNAPLWYRHGEDVGYQHIPVGMRYSITRFEFGLHVVHTLHQDHPLYQRTYEELVNGLLAYSSDSIGHYVDGGFNGVKLGVWPLAGFSLVPNPAEPGLGLVTLGQGIAK